jgi:hypothetical protein
MAWSSAWLADIFALHEHPIDRPQGFPLRQRMIDEMTVRNFAPNTQESYLHQVNLVARHFDRSPAHWGPEEIIAPKFAGCRPATPECFSLYQPASLRVIKGFEDLAEEVGVPAWCWSSIHLTSHKTFPIVNVILRPALTKDIWKIRTVSWNNG